MHNQIIIRIIGFRAKCLTIIRPVVISGIFISFIFGIFSLQSCRELPVSDQIRKADTLIKWASVANETLVIDPGVIRGRVDSMKIRLELLNKYKSRIVSEPVLFELKQYEGIYLRYRSFLDQYEAMEYDNLNDIRELNAIKKELIDQKMGTEEFERIYPVLRKRIAGHLDESKKLVRSITNIEEMYIRSDNDLSRVISDFKNQSHKS